MRRPPLRRLIGVGAVLATAALAACDAASLPGEIGPFDVGEPEGSSARLTARPAAVTGPVRPGLRQLGVARRRDPLLFVPRSAAGARAVPLIVWLHGAGGGRGSAGLERFRAHAERRGVAILLPPSRERTWDVIVGGYGRDVEVIDRALEETFRRIPVDPDAIALAGFSDGASYALSLGITNGDLFSEVIAASPGFVGPTDPHGEPRIFVSHGTTDAVLPIEATSREIVPELRRQGYRVRFVEFDGRHAMPRQIAERAFRWFVR